MAKRASALQLPFSTFPNHWPGVGLLLKRLSLEAALLLGKTPAAMPVAQNIIGVAAGVYVLVCGRQ